MISILTVCILFAFTLNYTAHNNPLANFSPPEDFVCVAEIDLSTQAYSAETLTEFILDQHTYVGVFITVNNIDTTYFDLSVAGPDGFRSMVLHGEGYNAKRDGGLWEVNLQPGILSIGTHLRSKPWFCLGLFENSSLKIRKTLCFYPEQSSAN